jgi:hypothetical protein
MQSRICFAIVPGIIIHAIDYQKLGMQKVTQYVGWTGVIGLLILPPFLVRSVNNDAVIRLTFYFILSLSVSGFFSYYPFSKSPLTKGSVFEKNFADQGKRNAEYLIRSFCALAAVAGLWMMANVVPSLIAYDSDPSSASIEVYRVGHIDSAAVPGAFYIRMGIRTEDGQYLAYWYPRQVLQTGSEYSFTLLPNRDFVLKAEPVR